MHSKKVLELKSIAQHAEKGIAVERLDGWKKSAEALSHFPPHPMP
jgi:hypothetical protein